MKFLQPNILIDFLLGYVISIRSLQTSLLLLFLKYLKHYLLFHLRHSVDLFHHLIKDIHDGDVEVSNASCIVKPRIVKGSHKVSLKQRTMACTIIVGSNLDHCSI